MDDTRNIIELNGDSINIKFRGTEEEEDSIGMEDTKNTIELNNSFIEIIEAGFTQIDAVGRSVIIEISLGTLPIQPGVTCSSVIYIKKVTDEILSLDWCAHDIVYKGVSCGQEKCNFIHYLIAKQSKFDHYIETIDEINKELAFLHFCDTCFSVATSESEDRCQPCQNNENILTYKCDDKCSICLEEITELAMTTSCGHYFHKKCILTCAVKQYLRENKSLCPMCKEPLLAIQFPFLDK